MLYLRYRRTSQAFRLIRNLEAKYWRKLKDFDNRIWNTIKQRVRNRVILSKDSTNRKGLALANYQILYSGFCYFWPQIKIKQIRKILLIKQ